MISSPLAIDVLCVLTAINVLVATGFSVAGLVRPKLIAKDTGADGSMGRTFGLYAAARTLPLAAVALFTVYVAFTHGNLHPIFIVGALAGIIQIADGFVGIAQKDAGKTIGPFVIGILQFVVLSWAHANV